MKKTLFKGKYLLNWKNYREAYHVNNWKTIYLFSAFSFILLLFWISFLCDNSITRWIVSLIFWIEFAFFVWLNNNTPKKIIKVIEADYYKDSVCTEVSFTDDEIDLHNLESWWKAYYNYNQIFKFYESKNLFIFAIWLPSKILYISKDSFEWDKEEFKLFIKEKIAECNKIRKDKKH